MVTILITAALAAASGNYPAELQAEAGIPCTPTCTLCHATNAGGGGTVTQAFGEALMARDLTGGGNTDALVAALAQLDADSVDSNDDGTNDLEALRAGENPNDGTPFCGDVALATPSYGCFQHARSGGSVALVVSALLVAATTRRRIVWGG